MNAGSAVFAVVMLLVGLVYESMALKMPRGTMAYPGPGLFPLIVGAFMIAMAAGCVLQDLLAWRRRARAAAPPGAPAATASGGSGDRAVRKTYQLTALTIAYILLLKPVGYPLCIAAFLVTAIRIFGYRRWVPTVALAVVIAALSYVSFVVWLKVPLPMGLLDEVLG